MQVMPADSGYCQKTPYPATTLIASQTALLVAVSVPQASQSQSLTPLQPKKPLAL
jgi:hypothetical protein